MIPVNRPLIEAEDVDAVTGAIRDGWISGEGPFISSFESALANAVQTRHAVAVTSGTTACDLLYDAVGIAPQDEVVLPATTIISTAMRAARDGAKLRLADADPVTWCAPAANLISRITARTRVVFPVHIYGLTVDIDPVVVAARDVGAWVFEDAAEAIGLDYKGRPCGSLADAGVFSFYANKTVTSGEGGAIVCDDDDLASKLRSMRNLSFSTAERFVHEELGINARMPSLSAALAKSQLARLDALIAKKREMGRTYQDGLRGHPWLQLPVERTDFCDNSYWVFGVVLNDDCPFDAPRMRDGLRALGVDSRRFFCPMNLQPVLRRMEVVDDEPMPVSEQLWQRGLYLPSGLGNTPSEIAQTIDALWSLVR